MYIESFPSKLRKARQDTGFTQREVAKEIGISQAQVSRLEKSALKSMKNYLDI